MKKVLVTGINGLVGRHLPYFLTQRGYEVWGLGRQASSNVPHVRYRSMDLFDTQALQGLCEELQPEYLIHLAWDTRPGLYLQDNANYQWLESGINLLRNFYISGGKRAVFAGTCLEYGFQSTPLKEDAPLTPLTPYAICKDLLHRAACSFSGKNGIEFAWGRIFYTYGPGEHENRLFPYIIRNLKSGKQAVLKSAQLVKDYIFAQDIAAAFASLLDSPVQGSINVCSGTGRSLGDMASAIAKILNREELLVLETGPSSEPPVIVGDNMRLIQEVGFKNFTPFDKGVHMTLEGVENI